MGRPRAAEAGMDLVPVAEALWQITPRNTSTVAVEHRLDKQAIVLGRDADMAFAAGQEVLDPFPLIIAQSIAAHRAAPFGQAKPSQPLTAPSAPLIEGTP